MASKISRWFPAIVAWLILLTVTGAFYVLVVPRIVEQFHELGIALIVVEAVLFLALIVQFYMVSIMDPGVLPKATESEEQQQDEFRAPLYKTAEVKGISVRMKWCATCHFYRPPRCSHCSVCDHCIDVFDHHCPWLNNCIGRRNYRQFFVYLILLVLHIVAVFGLCLLYTLRTQTNLVSKENITAMVIMVLAGSIFGPVVGLTGFHCFLIVSGRTTNEQVTGKFRSGYNPFDKGFCRNLAIIFCGTQFPRFSDYAGKQEGIDLLKLSRRNTRSDSPLLNVKTFTSHNPRASNNSTVDPERIHLYTLDEKQQENSSCQYKQLKGRLKDTSDGTFVKILQPHKTPNSSYHFVENKE